MTLRELLCTPKDRVATEDKMNIVYETDFSNCKTVYFGLQNRIQMNTKDLSGIAIVKRMKLYCWKADYNFNWNLKKRC